MSEDLYNVVMEGGSPWGFGIQGGTDFRSPLRVKTVTAGGRAAKSGLVRGDYIMSINSQETKSMKHMQAMQLIKNSTHRVELTCMKYNPGVISPAITQSFSFPATKPATPQTNSPSNPAQPVVKTQPPGVNGHAHESSVGSRSSQGTPEVFDAKYIGIDAYCIQKSQPLDDEVVQEPVQVLHVSEGQEVNYDLPLLADETAEVALSSNAQPEYTVSTLQHQEEEAPSNLSGESPPVDENSETASGECPVVEEVEIEPLPEGVADIECPTPRVSEDSTQVMLPDPVYELRTEIDDSLETTDAQSPSITGENVEVAEKSSSIPPKPSPPTGHEALSQNSPPDLEVAVDVDASPEKKDSSKPSPPKANLMDLVNVINSAAVRKRRESSTDSDDPTSKVSSVEKVPQARRSSGPIQSSPPTNKPAKQGTPTHKPPLPVRVSSIESKEPVVSKESLKKVDNPVAAGSKEPGWYKQMFQDFQNTVEDCFPGDSNAESEYVYDERGLKVKRDSLPKSTLNVEEARKSVPSPETPVYVYDERGLRVKMSEDQSLSSLSDQSTVADNSPSNKLSADHKVSTDDVLSENKKQTSYKANQYNTEGSRDYWRQKDSDHQEFEKQRRLSQEQAHSRQSSSDYSSKMTSMHPLLQAQTGENSKEDVAAGESVFDRIDASKLQGALENASMLSKLEKEGVATELLPGVAKEVNSEKSKPKEKNLMPPPGRKGKALFDFEARSSKELSFKKGDIIDLRHTVDENWLQGSIETTHGIFPTTYIQVLSLEEYQTLLSPEPKQRKEIGKAIALYDFSGQTEREISFKKGDEFVVEKKIDENWFEGFLGDQEGIFPTSYVKVI